MNLEFWLKQEQQQQQKFLQSETEIVISEIWFSDYGSNESVLFSETQTIVNQLEQFLN